MILEAGWVDDYMCERVCVERDLRRHGDVELCPLRNQVLGQQELETDSCTEAASRGVRVCFCASALLGSTEGRKRKRGIAPV